MRISWVMSRPFDLFIKTFSFVNMFPCMIKYLFRVWNKIDHKLHFFIVYLILHSTYWQTFVMMHLFPMKLSLQDALHYTWFQLTATSFSLTWMMVHIYDLIHDSIQLLLLDLPFLDLSKCIVNEWSTRLVIWNLVCKKHNKYKS